MQGNKWLRRACAAIAGATLTVGMATVTPSPAVGAESAGDKRVPDGPNAREPKKPERDRPARTAPGDNTREALSARRGALAVATTYTVDTTADDPNTAEDPVVCQTEAGECSLRAALQAANADPATVDRIVVPAGTITLVTDDLPVASHVLVEGAGAGATVIDGAEDFRAIYVELGSITLSGVTIQNARGRGAAIYVEDGAATLSGVHAVDNDAEDSDGGAIWVDYDSSLWVDGSTFARNVGWDGGALYLEGAALVTDSTFGGATADDGNFAANDGGGIYTDYDANLTLVNSVVRHNRAEGDGGWDSGGGIYNGGVASITGGSVSDNVMESESGQAAGGGIYNDGVMNVSGTEVARNVARGAYSAIAGGVYNDWQLQLTDVAVNGNVVSATEDDSWLEGAGVWNTYNLSIRGGTVNANRAVAIGDQGYDDGAIATVEGTSTLTSVSADFDADDAGKRITGTGIPEGTMISEVVDGDTVRLSQAATDGEGVSFVIVDRIRSYVAGAGLYNDYAADVENVTFDGNVADTRGSDAGDANGEYVEGGAIVNWYNLALRNVTISNTTANGDDVYGGAVLLDDNSSLQNVTVTNTTVAAEDYVEGGAIANWYDVSYASVNIDRTNVTVTGDDSSVYGGALYNYDNSPTTINDSSVTNTTLTVGDAMSIYGGAVNFEYELNATNLEVSGTRLNAGEDTYVEGGGLYSYYGGNFTDVRVDDNVLGLGEDSTTWGAGWYSEDWMTVVRGSVTGNQVTGGDAVYGAGMSAYYGLTGERITFANNTASTTDDGAGLYGGGIYIDDKTQLTNVTISGNSVSATGSASDAQGGGIYNDYPVTLTNVTIANNAASGSTDDPETEENDASTADAGGAIYASDNIVIRNSIVAGNTPAASQCATGGSESPRIHSAGWNIDSGESCNFDGPGDMENTDPQLGPLQDNGGPGLTHALLAGSPAIDTANAASCPAVDERGQSRPVGNGCDIGAYEYVAVPVTPPGGGETPVVAPGYWLSASDGGVFTFGAASFHGSAGNIKLNQPVVSMAATPSGGGYWLVASDGGVFTYGDAGYFGSTGAIKLNRPIVGMVPSPSGNGYWLVASDGGIFAFGDAPFFGSTGGMTLNAPIVNMGVRPNGDGYWLVASDGGVFTFGSAIFHGSTGNINLNKPIVDMIPTEDGAGYWLLASDGGLFTFGSAAFLGSMGGSPLNKPIVDGARSAPGSGYYMTASDGGVFTFGDAAYFGSTGAMTLNQPIVAMAVKG